MRTLNFVTINASKGPVYIGKDSEIMEGSIIRGPLALCEGAILKLGTKIYGPTTVGPLVKWEEKLIILLFQDIQIKVMMDF